ncbi:hypothetical protein C2G38_2146583 [Gigaspora rosea]|uniref:Uncharacterized protein n=1 Tax=Gigaspora rosea TaxID=44941 RepID=A0A397UQG9_9GLOM|nr:hypothetical protein C2G38_2146583 [Gigaspora rosea]
MEHDYILSNAEKNDPFLKFCDDLMNKTYQQGEFKDRLKYVLPLLYDRLHVTLRYFLELTVTDTVIKSINDYRSHDRELNRITQFVSFFEELIDDYELLKRMRYMISIFKRFFKANGDGSFDYEDRYCYSLKGLEICDFVDMLHIKKKYNTRFQKYYNVCHELFPEEVLFEFFVKDIRLFDTRLSLRLDHTI